MKRSLAIVLVAVAVAGVVACSGTHRRSDWRGPPPAAAASCTSDADCSGAPCAIELGASKGTCQPIDLYGPGSPGPRPAGGDGGARPAPPGNPLIQPSPSDIQI